MNHHRYYHWTTPITLALLAWVVVLALLCGSAMRREHGQPARGAAAISDNTNNQAK